MIRQLSKFKPGDRVYFSAIDDPRMFSDHVERGGVYTVSQVIDGLVRLKEDLANMHWIPQWFQLHPTSLCTPEQLTD